MSTITISGQIDQPLPLAPVESGPRYITFTLFEPYRGATKVRVNPEHVTSVIDITIDDIKRGRILTSDRDSWDVTELADQIEQKLRHDY